MFAIIRLRGSAGINRNVEDTLQMLRLKAVNNCVIVQETVDYKGMLEKVKDSITWGEIDKDVLISMLKKRLRLKSNEKINEKEFKSVTGYESEKLVDMLIGGKIKLKDLEKIEPVFRLTPPSKGFKSIKEHYPKGDLGYRGKEINELLKRMI
jgi:large subunit ribosomal protein L30